MVYQIKLEKYQLVEYVVFVFAISTAMKKYIRKIYTLDHSFSGKDIFLCYRIIIAKTIHGCHVISLQHGNTRT